MHRMFRPIVMAVVATMATIIAFPALAQQQPDPNSPRYKGVVALTELIGSSGDEAIHEFIESRIAASVRESMSDEDLFRALDAIRAGANGAEMRGGRPIGPLSAEIVMNHPDGTEAAVEFELDADDTDRFAMISSGEHTVGG